MLFLQHLLHVEHRPPSSPAKTPSIGQTHLSSTRPCPCRPSLPSGDIASEAEDGRRRAPRRRLRASLTVTGRRSRTVATGDGGVNGDITDDVVLPAPAPNLDLLHRPGQFVCTKITASYSSRFWGFGWNLEYSREAVNAAADFFESPDSVLVLREKHVLQFRFLTGA